MRDVSSTADPMRDWIVEWRPVEVLEAILGVLGVVVGDLLIPPSWGLAHLDLYVLWVVVLAIAARYGAPSGYVAGFLAAIAYQFLFVSGIDPNQPLYPHILMQSLLLFTAGVLVSEAVRARKRQMARLNRKLARTNDTMRLLSERLDTTLAVRAELERRIAIQPISTALVCEYAAKLANARGSAIGPIILELLTVMLDMERGAIYLIGPGQPPKFVLQSGLPARVNDRPLTLHPLVGISARAVAERRVITVHDQRATAYGDAEALIAGPLLDETGEVMGLIIIEQMPFASFTPAAIHLFARILVWAAASFRNGQIAAAHVSVQ